MGDRLLISWSKEEGNETEPKEAMCLWNGFEEGDLEGEEGDKGGLDNLY